MPQSMLSVISNTSVRTKVFGAVGFCIAMLIGVSVFAIVQMDKIGRELATIAEQKHIVVDELPVGGAVLFTHKTLHASLPNYSDAARWSLDIRYSVLGESEHCTQRKFVCSHPVH